MKERITAAFAHRTKPAAVTAIGVNSTLRNDAHHFEGFDRTKIDADDWQNWSDAFFGFSPDAFLYFLPSLLIVSLDQSLVAADALVSSLDTSAEPNIWDEWFAERFLTMTLPELQALRGWAQKYINGDEKGEASEFIRVQNTIIMLELLLES